MNNKKTTHARVQRPERHQTAWKPFCLDELLASDHRARVVWDYVDSLDFSELYGKIQAVDGRAGRTPVDPKILLSLWMFATLEGISSARHVVRLCERDLGYMWICGGVSVNHHLLSDFRSTNPEFFDELLTETVGTLISQGLVELDVIAQDGMRVRASAGGSSFRRQGTLAESLSAAKQRVEQLREETDDTSTGHSSRSKQEAAQLRSAEERQSRLADALEQLQELRARKEKRKKGSGKDARCSTTDPDARKMKVASGGYRPCYNVHLATTADTRVILDVEVNNNGSDGGQMSIMHDKVVARHGEVPKKMLVDGGFTTHADITLLESQGTAVYGPIPKEATLLKNGTDPYKRQPKDTDEVFKFRQRMATDSAKELFKSRPSIAEFPNAEFRNRGLQQYRVRSLTRVKSATLLVALTFNFMRWMALKGVQASI